MYVRLNGQARLGLALACLFLACGSATAAPVTYFGDDNPRGTFTNSFAARDSFLNSLDSYGIDTLENYKSFVADPTLTFAPLSITATTQVSFIAPSNAVSGTKALLDQGPTGAGKASIDDVFSISTPVTAFGLFIANIGDTYENTLSLILENTLLGPSATRTVVIGTFAPVRSQDNTIFFGVTDTLPFNKISVHESEDYDGTLYDNITVGYVPEPSTFVLATLGAGAVVLAARRRLAT